MAENGDIRVTLRWIEIKDSKDLDGEGEFRFHSTVTTGGQAHQRTLPEGGDGFWRISDHPLHNRVDKIDKVLYEGAAGDSLVVEIRGEELDKLSKNDELETYRMEFSGDASSWIGRHQPRDEGSDDPENLSDWRVCYEIERA